MSKAKASDNGAVEYKPKYVVRVDPQQHRHTLIAGSGATEGTEGGHPKVLALASYVTDEAGRTKVFVSSDAWGLEGMVTIEGMKEKFMDHTVYRILASVGDWLVEEGKLK